MQAVCVVESYPSVVDHNEVAVAQSIEGRTDVLDVPVSRVVDKGPRVAFLPSRGRVLQQRQRVEDIHVNFTRVVRGQVDHGLDH